MNFISKSISSVGLIGTLLFNQAFAGNTPAEVKEDVLTEISKLMCIERGGEPDPKKVLSDILSGDEYKIIYLDDFRCYMPKKELEKSIPKVIQISK